jgi:spore maturation protein SpmB
MLMPQIIVELKKIPTEAVQVSFSLFKIMIPIILGVKLFQELGLIAHMAMPLSPIMKLMGLPGEMGLVWATAMINNIYGAMIVFVSLSPQFPLTTAQVTVLGTIILIAHSLPIELEIARKSGNRVLFQWFMRMGSALLVGILLHHIYGLSGWLQTPNHLLWVPEVEPENLLFWGVDQLQNLSAIFAIIFGLITLMKILDFLKVTQIFIRIFNPLLRLLGIGPAAAPLTIIGMVMGLAYGGGLIIHEARSGKVENRDIFFAVSFMGLAHSVFEDTLLMVVLGAHLSGLLWMRVIYAMFFIFILVRVVIRIPITLFEKYLFKPIRKESK